MKFFKRIYKRKDNRKIILFNINKHTEKNVKEMEATISPEPHMRWHPFREEWVTYSAGREKRTAFPPEEYCPLCPGNNLNYPTEVPFNNFEIAVFPNRWASFKTHNNNYDIAGIETKPSNGICEIVVYSAGHNETIA